jgi:hypothetical protein
MGSAYTQGKQYIPRSDAAFRDWLLNFSALLSADPARYGVSSAEAAAIAGHAGAFDEAYQAAQAPATRTSVAIAHKDVMRAAANAPVRTLAQQIKADPGVAGDDKIALGIHVDDAVRSPVPAPTSAPLLMLVSSFSGVHQLRYADERTPAARRKPAGAAQLQLNVAIAPGPVTDPAESQLYGLFTKQPIRVEHDPGKGGEAGAQTATYLARWVTRTGKFGPWSLPQSMTIAFAGPAMGRGTAGGPSAPPTADDNLKIAA